MASRHLACLCLAALPAYPGCATDYAPADYRADRPAPYDQQAVVPTSSPTPEQLAIQAMPSVADSRR